MAYALLISSWFAAIGSQTLSDPLAVRGTARGVHAVGRDAAGAALTNGAELSVHSRAIGDDDPRQLGVYAAVPVQTLTLHGGYEWLHTDALRGRGSIGFGAKITPALAIGIDYGWLHAVSQRRVSLWNAALLAEPASWLSVAVGVQQFNEPQWGNERLIADTWAGVGVRPVCGAPWLTVGSEAIVRLHHGQDVLRALRLTADIAPQPGLHVRASYEPDNRKLWLGVRVSILGVELDYAGGGEGTERLPADDNDIALTWYANPAETALSPSGRTIEIGLHDDLRGDGGLLHTKPLVSPVPLALARLADDASVSRVVLVISNLSIGGAEVDELRGIIRKLRRAGKEVVAELAGGAENEYVIAAAANRIRLDPAASLTLNGHALSLLYFADAMSKLGVRFESVEIGHYKTGPDPLTRSRPRDEDLAVANDLLTQRMHTLSDALVNDRRLPTRQVAEILEESIFTPSRALALGLVDELSQPTAASQLPTLREHGEPLPSEPAPSTAWGRKPVIAIIAVVGNITAHSSGSVLPGEVADATALVTALNESRLDPSISAVVLRIDSPGGEVFASEVIWRAARLLAASKPLVVSMGNVAASGGYYIAAPARVILAQPGTITGSIGIYLLKPDLTGLLQLTGTHAELVKQGKHAAMSSAVVGWSDEEREITRKHLAAQYETFLDRVATGRNLSMARVRELAEGRVYTGQQALTLGLVDGIGDLADAINEAKAQAGLSRTDAIDLRFLGESDGLQRLLGTLARATTTVDPKAIIAECLKQVQALAHEPLARLPFEPVEVP